MATLIVGYDSAWTAGKCGAVTAVALADDGSTRSLGSPQSANFDTARQVIHRWQQTTRPDRTVLLIDQPTIVTGVRNQRPVENLVGSPVSKRRGGVQPAYTNKADMFGPDAPIWPFLKRFGGPADPRGPLDTVQVFETYPVLTLIAYGWLLPDSRKTGRLPKYNPEKRKQFRLDDWRFVCMAAADAAGLRGLAQHSEWLTAAATWPRPSKCDQDCLDACICLLVGVDLCSRRECLMVGEMPTGYMVVPASDILLAELTARCVKTQRTPAKWLQVFRLA